MSYNKAMKHSNNHRKDKFTQSILGMPFKENEHVESYYSVAKRTATGYNIRVANDIHDKFKQISQEFTTEDEAIDYINDNNIEDQYLLVRIYSTEGMHISGW